MEEDVPTMDSMETLAEERTLVLEGGTAQVKVEVRPDGSVRFTEDVDAKELPSLMDVTSLKVFTDAGIDLKRGIISPDTDTYDLADENNSGWLHIRQESLNDALEREALQIVIDEDGDLQLG